MWAKRRLLPRRVTDNLPMMSASFFCEAKSQMKTPVSWLAVIAVLFGAAAPAEARLVQEFTYQALFDRADVVVIAQPISKTADTNESTFFSDMVRQDSSGRSSKVAAIGVVTSFKVLKVIKGEQTLEQFVLHHFRELNSPEIMVDGPMVMSFDPADPKRPREFLMFLVREGDGRYAPYGGQTDPWGRSIMSLD